MTVPLDALAALLGPAGLLTDPADVASYTTDWTGSVVGEAAAVLRPASTEQVAACVRLCRETGVAIVPQGGNTGLAAGAVPTTTGEQAEAARAGRLFPLSLGSEGSCTVGGNVATNAGGTAVLRYGMMRELVLGLEVVLPDGRVWDGLRPLRKDNTGYSLKDLFVGSEGTLGIVTAAVLRLFPATPRRATAFLALPSVEAAVGVLGALREHAGGSLATWELVSREALSWVLREGGRDPFTEAHE